MAAGDTPNWDPPETVITAESVVLGVLNWWSTNYTHKQVVAMVDKNFKQDDILEAQKALETALGESGEPKKRQNSQLRLSFPVISWVEYLLQHSL